MPLDRSGKADCLAGQTLDPGAQREMLPLDLLRVALAWGVLVSVEMTRVRAPIIGVMVVLHRVCCHFRQIVMADAPLDGPDVMLDCLGERQRCTDETGESLPERI